MLHRAQHIYLQRCMYLCICMLKQNVWGAGICSASTQQCSVGRDVLKAKMAIVCHLCKLHMHRAKYAAARAESFCSTRCTSQGSAGLRWLQLLRSVTSSQLVASSESRGSISMTNSQEDGDQFRSSWQLLVPTGYWQCPDHSQCASLQAAFCAGSRLCRTKCTVADLDM